jgi:hypothetical protein
VGFLSLILACFVFARRFAALRQWGWAAFSTTTGVAFLAASFALAAWPSQAGVNVGLVVAVVLGWGWASAMAARLMTALTGATRSINVEIDPMLSR